MVRTLLNLSNQYWFNFILFLAEKDESAEMRPSGGESDGTPETQLGTTGGREMSTAPDSPSKQLPDQISFFSGNPSVEIVHGIMHLYKTK